MEITQKLLHELFEYKNGYLYWIKPTSRKAKVGNIAGNENAKGRSIGIFNKNFGAHRLTYLYHHGYLPPVIDHIDGNPYNNRIENLRAATQAQNMRNMKKMKINTSGAKNVSKTKNNTWRVRLRVNLKEKIIGHFKDFELAELVATEARIKYFGSFARHE